MARDFDFKGVGQADFTNTNQMYAQARQAWDNALATAQATLDQTNKAVTNRNEAVLQDFMNSIPKEEWGTEESNQRIDNAFSKMAELTGNMYDAKVMNAYRDNRGQVLLEQDNAKLTNKEVTQKWQQQYENYQIDKLAETIPQLEAIITNPALQDTPAYQEAEKQLQAINEQFGVNPHWASKVNDRITALTTDREKAQEALTIAQLTPHLPDINTLADKWINIQEQMASLELPEDADEATKAEYEKNLTALQADSASVQALLKPYTDRFGARVHQIIDGLRGQRRKGKLESEKTQSEIYANRARGQANLISANTGVTKTEYDFVLGSERNTIEASQVTAGIASDAAKQVSDEAKVNASMSIGIAKSYGLTDAHVKGMLGKDGKVSQAQTLQYISGYADRLKNVLDVPTDGLTYDQWAKQVNIDNKVNDMAKNGEDDDKEMVRHIRSFMGNNKLSDLDKRVLMNEASKGANSSLMEYNSKTSRIGTNWLGERFNVMVSQPEMNRRIVKLLNQERQRNRNENMRQAQQRMEGIIKFASQQLGMTDAEFIANNKDILGTANILPFLPSKYKQ